MNVEKLLKFDQQQFFKKCWPLTLVSEVTHLLPLIWFTLDIFWMLDKNVISVLYLHVSLTLSSFKVFDKIKMNWLDPWQFRHVTTLDTKDLHYTQAQYTFSLPIKTFSS